MTTDVVNVKDRQRYEIVRTARPSATPPTRRPTSWWSSPTPRSTPSLEGQGIGGLLVRGALDDVRGRGLAVLPICPFVQAWMSRHPDYADLDYRSPGSTVTD